MEAWDRELRALLADASAGGTLSGRDALLDTLTERIEDGGDDVAAIPALPPALEPAGPAVLVREVGRRAATTGIGGWAAIGIASAAAAGGAWLLDTPATPPATADVPSVTAPVPEAVADAEAKALTIVPPVIASVAPDSDAPGSDDASPSDTAPVILVAPRGDGLGREGADGAAGASGSHAAPDVPGPTDAHGATGSSGGDGSVQAGGTGGLGLDLGAVEDGVTDAVEELLPDGPVQDTVAPLIHAVDVNGLVGWVVSSLLCGDQAPVAVQASDDVGVTEVSLTVTTATGHTQSIPLSRGGGSTWTGLLAPITALELGLLDRLVDIEVSARDAAGNVSLAHSTVRVSVLSCLG